MKSLKLTIKFTSPVGSLLQSDTIFGQFAWWYRYMYGEDKLKEMLDDFDSSPFIVFSDGFLENTIPMPFIRPKSLQDMKEFFYKTKGKDFDYYSQIKKLKKAKFVSIDSSWIGKEKLDIFDLYNFIYKEEVKTTYIAKNSVNRLTNTVDAGLYSTSEMFFQKPIDIYVKFDENKIDKDTIEQVFDSIGQFGFGRDKSTGKGRFRIVNIIDNPKVLNRKKGKMFISLSSGIPDKYCNVLFGKTFTKFGKHGGTLVFGNPFKNPIVLFKSGSVFNIEEYRDVYGLALSVSKYDGHYHNAYMLPVFVDMEE